MSRLKLVSLTLAALAGALPAFAQDDRPVNDSGRVPAPNWIWDADAAEGEKLFLQRTFDVPSDVSKAALLVAADNRAGITINGQKVLTAEDWVKPAIADVTGRLRKGKSNQIIISASNADGPAGVLVRLRLTTPDGSQDIVSDSQWRVAPDDGPKKGRDWQPATEVATLGGEPWGKVTEETLAVADRLREPTVTRPEDIRVPEGFTVDVVYDVPADTQGSWVSMTAGPDNTLIVSDQYGALYRVMPGESSEKTSVEKLDLDVGHAQGLLVAFDSLYVMVNSRERQSGLYRCSDSTGDGTWDAVKLLLPLQSTGGEHGPHAIVLTPDGEGLYLICGNQTELPGVGETMDGESLEAYAYTGSRVPEIWGEDEVTPRIYGRAFMRNKMAPGGYVLRINPDASERVIQSVGYRNQYDAALNWRGDLFTYDADMEWDWNTPWYRPTRICEAASGVDFGWRNGSAKFAETAGDSLSPVLNIGPGSPTGVVAGTGAKFPVKYQDAIYACDWTYGKMYAIHLTPEGGGYAATKEEFCAGTPLPFTDAVVGGDGHLYFAIGGRRIKSGLYRVRYTGDEDTSPAVHAQFIPELHRLRLELEELHLNPDHDQFEFIWKHLGHADIYVRSAARVALEQLALAMKDQPQMIAEGLKQAAAEPDVRRRVTAALAIVRLAKTLNVEEAAREDVAAALPDLDWSLLDLQEKRDVVRTLGIASSRLGEFSDEARTRIVSYLTPVVDEADLALASDALELMVALDWKDAAPRGTALLRRAATQEQQIAVAKSLRLVEKGWNDDDLRTYLDWFNTARTFRGGMSFELYVNEIREPVVDRLTDQQEDQFEDVLNRPIPKDALAAEPRPVVSDFTMESAFALVETGMQNRDFDNGRKMYAAAKCAACHRFGVDGGAIGPDLTGLAGRFRPYDLLESIIHPSKVISDQYASKTWITLDGRVVTGRVANLSGDTLRINTNMLDPAAMVNVDRTMIDEVTDSPVSMMPEGLLNTLSEEEMLDLMAYLLSRGDASDPMFTQEPASR